MQLFRDSFDVSKVHDMLLYSQIVKKHVLLRTVAEETLHIVEILADILGCDIDISLTWNYLLRQHFESG